MLFEGVVLCEFFSGLLRLVDEKLRGVHRSRHGLLREQVLRRCIRVRGVDGVDIAARAERLGGVEDFVVGGFLAEAHAARTPRVGHCERVSGGVGRFGSVER